MASVKWWAAILFFALTSASISLHAAVDAKWKVSVGPPGAVVAEYYRLMARAGHSSSMTRTASLQR